MRGHFVLVHGEPTAGKSLVMAEATRQVVADGENVVFLDYEGTGRGMAERLAELGTDTGDADRITYLRPGSAPLATVARLAVAEQPALVVVDGLASALANKVLMRTGLVTFCGSCTCCHARWRMPAPRSPS